MAHPRLLTAQDHLDLQVSEVNLPFQSKQSTAQKIYQSSQELYLQPNN